MLFMHFLFASRVIANFKLQVGPLLKLKRNLGDEKQEKWRKMREREKIVLFEPFHVSYSSVKFSRHY